MLFDAVLGKIIGVPNRDTLCSGALITYTLQQNRLCDMLRDIEILDVPFKLARIDILFFHHVLEMCYYSMPVGLPAPELFEWLELFCTSSALPTSVDKRKLLLLKLFGLLGMYPENQTLNTPNIHYLLSLPIDSIVHESIKLENEQEINNWLLGCVVVHPYVNYFKTITFLTKSRVV